MMIFIALLLFGPQYHSVRAYDVTSVPPILLHILPLDTGFVIGTDGQARNCPNTPNVHTYVRSEDKGAQDVFVDVPRDRVIISNAEHQFTIACIVVK